MKPRPAGFVDNKLKQRVIQYLTSNRCGKYVDTGFLASDLQRMYSIDYGRRKRNAFRIQVEKLFNLISNEKGLNDLAELEDEHLAKRSRQGGEDNGNSDSDFDDSNMEDYPDPQSANHMNSSLLSLYRKGNPDSVSSTPEMERREPTTSALPRTSKDRSVPSEASATVSPGGWFIDRTPSGKKESFFLDLADEHSNTKKPVSEIQDAKDSSLLESDNKQKVKRKSKGNKRKKEDLQDVDGEIEDVLQKKAKPRGLELQTSSMKFEDVGGNDTTLKEVCKMLIHMCHPEVYHHLGVVPPRGLLLHGPPGCGKTLLAHAIAGELDLPLLKVAATEVVSGVSGESEQKLRELFEQAVDPVNRKSELSVGTMGQHKGSALPQLAPRGKPRSRRRTPASSGAPGTNGTEMYLNNVAVTARVLVIGATNRPDALDPALRRAGRFDREICLGIPDEASRERILQTLCRKLKLPETFNFRQLAHLTPGFVGADLMALCREAAMCSVNRVLMKLQEQQNPDAEAEGLLAAGSQEARTGTVHTSKTQDELQRLLGLLRDQDPLSEERLRGLCIELNDFIVALDSVQPSAKREGFVTVPDVTWADIGALEDIREELTMAILAPVRNPDQFKALGLVTPAGVLLAGPPGCGKTLLAKAVANESGLNFISVKGPELLNMYVGESERAVRQVFQRAKNSAPCVIFFDEVDALCPRRSDREAGASVRVVNQLLTEMDGLETRQQVFIMAATNRPDIIDPAILRPGRLDKMLFVGLPPPADRLAILRTITKNGTKPPLDAEVNLEAIAGDIRCDCYTGADLSALVREASLSALRQDLANQETGKEKGELKISLKHFEEAFKKVKPSVSKKDQVMYEALQRSLRG
ncbi:nuclear valosin-containing protein-like isoform X2 [Tenrec ecaudatus]|uniref:nuclear valosin-containing protein-like isoform X2 n=1 Tax=Tenrec ecaudatus TaxID=94439 RepID=UPI003F5AAC53